MGGKWSYDKLNIEVRSNHVFGSLIRGQNCLRICKYECLVLSYILFFVEVCSDAQKVISCDNHCVFSQPSRCVRMDLFLDVDVGNRGRSGRCRFPF